MNYTLKTLKQERIWTKDKRLKRRDTWWIQSLHAVEEEEEEYREESKSIVFSKWLWWDYFRVNFISYQKVSTLVKIEEEYHLWKPLLSWGGFTENFLRISIKRARRGWTLQESNPKENNFKHSSTRREVWHGLLCWTSPRTCFETRSWEHPTHDWESDHRRNDLKF